MTVIAPVRGDQVAEARRNLDGLCDELDRLAVDRGSRSGRPARGRGQVVGLLRGDGLESAPTTTSGGSDSTRAWCEGSSPAAGSIALLFEYWHAYRRCIGPLREVAPKFVLDMHNVLWVSHCEKLDDRHGLPGPWKRWSVARYRRGEERAWSLFDGVIAINREELKYASSVVAGRAEMFYAPMGIDLGAWPYSGPPAAGPDRLLRRPRGARTTSKRP